MAFISLLVLILITVLAQSIYNVKKDSVDNFVSGIFNRVEGAI